MSIYGMARRGVFLTAQGEGRLSGEPTVFVRLAGCDVGCDGCDTDYRAHETVAVAELEARVRASLAPGVSWLWLTGGEPTMYDLAPLAESGRRLGLKVALATAGQRHVRRELFDFVSVSPHSVGPAWLLREGEQVNFVPGLNGLRLEDLAGLDLSGFPPNGRFVTPPADRDGRPRMVRECLGFVTANKGWRLGCQAHKWWGVE